jgi:pimeloyl-ACP methyl ester carboxylesterase
MARHSNRARASAVIAKLDPTHHGFESLRLPADGVSLHLARAGSGRPLLLLHGWPEFWLTWAPCMRRLEARFQLLAPDLRGFGASDKPSTGPSRAAGPEVHAADALALLDHLGIAKVGVVGHDVGAYVAQALARQQPERIAGLFFFNCPYPGIGRRWAEAGHLIEIWYQSFHQMPWAAGLVGSSRDACRTYIGHFLRHWAHDPHVFDADLEAWTDNFLRPGNLQGGFNWYLSVATARAAVIREEVPPLPKIALPTRIMWGRHDPILKVEWVDRIGEFFEDPEVTIAEDAGHFVHYETPDAAAAEIAAFFDRLSWR